MNSIAAIDEEEQFVKFVLEFESGVLEKQRELPNLWLGEDGGDSGDGVIAIAAKTEAIAAEYIERLEDSSQIPDSQFLNFFGRVGRGGARLSSYSFDDDSLFLVGVLDGGVSEDTALKQFSRSELLKAAEQVRRARLLTRENIDPSRIDEGFGDFIDTVDRCSDRALRLIILVNGIAKISSIELDVEEDDPATIVEIWDLERLYRLQSSDMRVDSIEINLMDYLGQPLDALAQTDVSSEYKVYLAVLPGDLLFQLYERHGPRLLELNVRSFLQARNKVNQGIRDTLINCPSDFLAYNNGISITVEDIDVTETAKGSVSINSVRGLQIVNGGQTTASIHRARKRDNVDLSKVRVQAKITQIVPDRFEAMVPEISRFSNRQTNVQDSDLTANNPFHVEIERLARQIWTPGQVNKWFYERAKGQFEVARNREGTTPAKVKIFDGKYPRRQKFDKLMLAKVENIWAQKPHVVAMGSQKNHHDFISRVSAGLATDDYYRSVVAKLLLVKAAEGVARALKLPAYRANAVAYTVALVSYRTGKSVDLEKIWQDQGVSSNLIECIQLWMPVVMDLIITSAAGKNISEWAKKAECWSYVQNLDVEIPSLLMGELKEGTPLPNVGKWKEKGKATDLSEPEILRQRKVMAMTADEIQELFDNVSGYLNDHGMRPIAWNAMVGCISTIKTYAMNDWTKIPTPKQTRQIERAIEFLSERQTHNPS